MILSLVEDFVNLKFDELNEALGETVKVNPILNEMQFENMPMSDTAISYLTFITSQEAIEEEPDNIDLVSCRIDFYFLISNKDSSIYKQIFNRYMYAMRRLIKDSQEPFTNYSNSGISLSLEILEIMSARITNGDRFEDNHYKPSIEFVLKVYDANEELSSVLINPNPTV